MEERARNERRQARSPAGMEGDWSGEFAGERGGKETGTALELDASKIKRRKLAEAKRKIVRKVIIIEKVDENIPNTI